MRIFHHIHVVQGIQKSTEIWSIHVDVLQSTAQREKKKNGSYVPYDPFFHLLANQDIIVFYRCRCRAVAVLFFSTPKKTRKGDISTSYSSIQYSILVYFRSFGTERLPKGKKVQTQRKGFIYFIFLFLS